MSIKTYTEVKGAPAAAGPYSVAAEANGFVFLSGQVGLVPETGKLIEGGIEVQAKQVLANIGQVLSELGISKEQVVKSTIFLADIKDFATVNQIYADFFGTHRPARSTFQVGALPVGALVEIEVIAQR